MSYKRLVYQEVAAQGNSLDPLLTNKQVSVAKKLDY